MTQKDGSPEASEGPYWSEELLAVLVVGLGDETQARETLEGIIQQALSGRALQGIYRGLCLRPYNPFFSLHTYFPFLPLTSVTSKPCGCST